jgi:hypothetical protein
MTELEQPAAADPSDAIATGEAIPEALCSASDRVMFLSALVRAYRAKIAAGDPLGPHERRVAADQAEHAARAADRLAALLRAEARRLDREFAGGGDAKWLAAMAAVGAA